MGETKLRLQQQGGSLFTEATAKYYKQQIAKSELLAVHYSGRWEVAKRGGIPGVTAWSEIPVVERRMGGANCYTVSRHRGRLLGLKAARGSSGSLLRFDINSDLP